jgi:glucose-6-phosphate 1-dehydrogenase
MVKATIVIFGGTGDLVRLKVGPALADLVHEGQLDNGSLICGIARGEFTNETYASFLASHMHKEHEKKGMAALKTLFFRKDSTQKDALKDLDSYLAPHETRGQIRIYYLAVGHSLFAPILTNIKSAKLHKNNARIVFEKPFGSDVKSSKELDRALHRVFDESHIYRIDHYLGKETVQNLHILKFSNPLFSHTLSSTFVDKIEIISNETLGVGQRLGYYDTAGSLKDMIQSHLLQLASLVLMEKPASLSAHDIHNEKVKALKCLKVFPASTHILGQYQTYQQELMAANRSTSKTDTFSRIQLECNNKRWRGTKLFLQTGKKLDSKIGQIIIHFKSSDYEHSGIMDNKLVIDTHPSEDVKLYINTRKRFTTHAAHVPLVFSAQEHFGPNTADGYKKLIGDVLVEDMTLFARNDEVLQSWNIVEQIESIRSQIPFVVYPDGSSTHVIQKYALDMLDKKGNENA